MTVQHTEALEAVTTTADVDVGNPVEWMVDQDAPETILGVTYEFSQTGERRTVWYTANKRRPKKCAFAAVTHLQWLETSWHWAAAKG
jgi:hypothetical protein